MPRRATAAALTIALLPIVASAERAQANEANTPLAPFPYARTSVARVAPVAPRAAPPLAPARFDDSPPHARAEADVGPELGLATMQFLAGGATAIGGFALVMGLE